MKRTNKAPETDAQRAAREDAHVAARALIAEREHSRKEPLITEQKLMSGEKREVPKRTGGPVSF